jgi:hypothetical protein
MSIIDTSILIERVGDGKAVSENISAITLIEYPMISGYGRFSGKIFYPDKADFDLALELQERPREEGRMKGAADLIIAATCINNNEKLIANDSDFVDISRVSKLKLI